ncbi:hypothetical protein GWI33_019377 [Rhynchophorus ferrugineus]|uniref:Fatty acyl-CoA reductase n=1 Tax=Rhynchophorus ferrugineus TaxID=354439 RepID=A0A834HTW6_RHYFE|nr:hypothetical protein GWI33_019377 [Rhynchophorus ferrugineus]
MSDFSVKYYIECLLKISKPQITYHYNMKSKIINDSSMNNITKYYENSKIFITGATGFVGKALLEKLLRSCEKIDSIFLLIRPKAGVTVQERLKDLLKNPLFDIIKGRNVDMNKIKVLTGDVSMPNLGLTDQDLRYLLENIDIVFHSAATVKFNEKLKDAVMLNTLATKHLLEICSEMKKLKSFVHISTAFSNADRKTIEEKVYTPNYNADTIIYLIQNLPEEFIESISEILLGEHPNTYTFTKVLAEQIVLNYSNLVPVAIVRPSISLSQNTSKRKQKHVITSSTANP